MSLTLDGTNGINSPSFTPTSSTVPISGQYLPSANTLGFVTASIERLRIDGSGNVGIGVSPTSLLTTVSSGQVQIGTTAWPTNFVGKSNARTIIGNEGVFVLWNEAAAALGNAATIYLGPKGSGTNGSTIIAGGAIAGVSESNSTNNGALTFATNGGSGNSEKMRLDSSGNLGLGVTPSAWSGIGSAIELKGNAYIASTTQVLSLCTNAYFNGTNFIYKSSSFANRYDTVFGEHRWYTAASGTAGNAITFTQAMTLDANGRLGIGQTSVVNRLDVLSSGSYSAVVDMTTAQMRLKHSTFPVQLYAGLDHVNRFAYMQASETGVGYRDLLLQPAGGNLIVGGTTSYGGKLQSSSTYIRSADGNSSQGCGFVASDFAGNEWHFGRNTTNGYYYVVRQTGTGMYMNTNAWVATSDSRAKKNVQNLESSLDKVTALRPVRFDWISDDTQDVGFIAQEVLPLIPEAVDVQEDPEAMMGISKERMIPFLVKAIQELSAELNELKQRIK